MFDASSFSGRVPVFPLPNVVLFPGTVLPLHIFEPRYREMMRVALEGERLIAMALLRPGWEENYYGNPPIHDVLGLGRIADEVRLPDGRYTLALHGVARVRVREIVSSDPYRTARVDVLKEVRSESLQRQREMMALFTRILGADSPPELERIPLGDLCDVLASMIPLDATVKQELLEEIDVAARSDRILSRLKEIGARSNRYRSDFGSLN